MPARQGRPPRNLAQAQVRCDKERARKAKFVKCAECEFPNCSGWVSQTTAQRHLDYTLAQQVVRDDLKGVEDLIAGYPPPLGVDFRPFAMDDDGESDPEENIDHPDPDNFGLVEEDTDMEDGLGQDLDDPDSLRCCVRVRVVDICIYRFRDRSRSLEITVHSMQTISHMDESGG